MNFGYVLVPDASINGRRSVRQDVWRASLANEWAVADKTKLLAEAYWRTADEAGGAHRLGWNVGFKHKARDDLSLHAAIGESLRRGNRGGPELRVYFGIKYKFAAPWRSTLTP